MMIKNLKWIIQKIWQFYGTSRVVDKLRGEEKQYLKNGKYLLIPGPKVILYCNEAEKSAVALTESTDVNLTGRKAFIYRCLQIIFTRKNDHGGDGFNGDIMLLPFGGNKKFFDIKRNSVLTVCESSCKFNCLKDACERFKSFFEIPNSSFTDNLIIEQMIFSDSNWSRDDKVGAFIGIVESYQKYLKNGAEIRMVSVSEIYAKAEEIAGKDKIQKVFGAYKEDLIKIQLPVTFIHGDLHYGNLLKSKKDGKVYVIDWETSREDIFFYDLLNVFYVDAVFNSDCFFIEKYFNGELDSEFEKIFNAVSFTYDADKRLLLFLCYLISRIIFDSSVDRVEALLEYVQSKAV